MRGDRWEHLEELLDRALRLPPEDRAALVARETDGDPELRAELEALLEADPGAAEYLSDLREDLLGSRVRGLLETTPAEADAPDPWIGRTISHYEILDRLGSGGMGVVYRARDVRLDRTVALKFIAPEIRRDPRARARFEQEARAASALDHPNICTIHEIAGTDDGASFIVMAAYEGETLRARLDRAPLSPETTLDLVVQVARALAAAHERGIVHRDVKPGNVFLTREGVVKLLDFGLARSDDGRMSGSAGAEGTVAYMSPEQVRGNVADPRSDVWALGVILFELLAGVRPFAAETPDEAVQLILTHQPDLGARRPDLAPELVNLVHRALAKAPEERFAHGGELLRALDGVRAAGREGAPRHRSLRRWASRVGVLVLTLSGIGAGVLLWRPRTEHAAGSVAGAAVSHILWVDDSPEGNASVIRRLEAMGVQVTTALSTSDALRLYDPATHQLVVSDMGRYEGVDGAYVGRAGFDLLEGLRARNPTVPLAFCTSERAVAMYRAEAEAAGALAAISDCSEVIRLSGR